MSATGTKGNSLTELRKNARYYFTSNELIHACRLITGWSAYIHGIENDVIHIPRLFMVALCNRADHYIFAL